MTYFDWPTIWIMSILIPGRLGEQRLKNIFFRMKYFLPITLKATIASGQEKLSYKFIPLTIL